MSESATLPPVLEGITLTGRVNTTDDQVLANIAASLRLGYPQIRPQPPQPDRVLLVGGGPSLADTEQALIDLYFAGGKIVTVNGAYAWCLDRRLRPSAQILLDARPDNARFLTPAVPQCRYLLASQCAPAVWEAVAGREDVRIWHAVSTDGPAKDLLDRYYQGHWQPIDGGTTVVLRAILLLRTLGFYRFDLFGVDSCWLGDAHHAFPQPENEADRRYTVTVAPTSAPDRGRRFTCSPWHLQQLHDFLQIIRVHGEHFLLNVHGDGLLAYALRANADLSVTSSQE